ncbi:MAG: 1-acyl-sn-glycerol-3-phosphate acyltransferase [Bacteroidales bacterium]|nr:1-acyl-sn-glycerol-3-phosphate acyltransferase [Bacteroidales bacterium]
MALLPDEELLSLSSFFATGKGKALMSFLRRVVLPSFTKLYEKNEKYHGAEFADHVLRDQGVDYLVGGVDVLRNLPDGPFITVSNHPYGGVDGLVLVDLIRHLKPDFMVMVNKILSVLHPMEEAFISVTPNGESVGKPTLESISGTRRALAHIREGHPLGLFPSGAVSDLSLKEGRIRDRQWQKPIVRFIMKAGVPVIPVRFFDRNTLFYYILGLIDWRVRLLRLPKEVTNKGGKILRVAFGEPISPERQALFGNDPDAFGKFLRESVYGMPLPEKFIKRSELCL